MRFNPFKYGFFVFLFFTVIYLFVNLDQFEASTDTKEFKSLILGIFCFVVLIVSLIIFRRFMTYLRETDLFNLTLYDLSLGINWRDHFFLSKEKTKSKTLHETYIKTLDLLNEGYSIDEIARERDLKKSTIEKHVEKLDKNNALENIDVKKDENTTDDSQKNEEKLTHTEKEENKRDDSERIDHNEFYEWQKELISKHLNFYEELEKGERDPKTKAQKHFVKVLNEEAEPITKHEYAYLRYKEAKNSSD